MRVSRKRTSGRGLQGRRLLGRTVWRRVVALLLSVALSVFSPGGVATELSGLDQPEQAGREDVFSLRLTFQEGDLRYFESFEDTAPAARGGWAVEGGVLHAEAQPKLGSVPRHSYLLLPEPLLDFQIDAQMTFLGQGESGFAFGFVDLSHLSRLLINYAEKTVTLELLDGEKIIARRQVGFLAPAVPRPIRLAASYDGEELSVSIDNQALFTHPLALAPARVGIVVKDQEDLLVHDLFVSSASAQADTENDPPQFAQLVDRVAMATELISFPVSASDPEGDPVTVTGVELPTGSRFRDGVFSWVPPRGKLGEFRASFEASDGRNKSSVSISIFILAQNPSLLQFIEEAGVEPSGPFDQPKPGTLPPGPWPPIEPPGLPLTNPLGTAEGSTLASPNTSFSIPGTNINVNSSKGVLLIGGGKPVVPPGSTAATSSASILASAAVSSATSGSTASSSGSGSGSASGSGSSSSSSGSGSGSGSPSSSSAALFSNDTVPAGLSNIFAQGAAVADVNGDGLEDLYVGNPFGSALNGGTNNVLFRNVGGTAFVNETALRAADGPAATQGAVFGDIDNDGDPDLYLPVVGANVFLENQNGVFVDRTGARSLGDAGSANGGVFADFDADGLLDLYVINSGGFNVLYRNVDAAAFQDVTVPAGLQIFQTTKAAVVFDFDLDGDPDIFNANVGKAHQLFRNNGDLTFTDVAASVGVDRTAVATNVGLGDLDRDGDQDLVVTHLAAGGVMVFENRVPQGGGFVDRTAGSGLESVDFPMAATVGDFDNDGDADLYFPRASGDNLFFQNKGLLRFELVADAGTAEPRPGFDAAAADLSGDGKLDLYVVGVPGRYYRNAGTTGNHFLQVRLRGVQSNRSGVGARVEVHTNPLSASQLTSGSGRSGASRLLHFGLGAATAASQVTVHWPSGVSQTLLGVAGDQVLDIKEIEPPALSVVGATTGSEGETLTFTVAAEDPDGDLVTLSASGLPTLAQFVDHGNNQGTFTFSPDFNQAGTYSVVFSGFDGTFTRVLMLDVTIQNVNRAPDLDAIGPQSVVEGNTLTLTITASDPDGDTLTFSAQDVPSGAQFTDNQNGTATLMWIPGAADIGNHPVVFRSSDGFLTDEETVPIAVISLESINVPPSLQPLPASVSVHEGESLVLEPTALDADGISGSIVLDAPTKPAGSTFSQIPIPSMTFAQGLFSWVPDFSQAGTHTVRFTAFDGFAASERTVTLQVENVNQAPHLADPGSETVRVGETLVKTITASDPDGDSVSLTAASLPQHATFTDLANGTGTFSFTPAGNQVGTVSIDFTASDGTLSDTVTLEVIVDAPGPSGPFFSDVTQMDGMQGTGSASSAAVARDFDADGDTDLVVLNDAEAGGAALPISLFATNAGPAPPSHIDIANPTDVLQFGGVAAGDFDRDQDTDLLIKGSGIYLQNQGGGAFVDKTVEAGLALADGEPILADIDSDGLLDVFVVSRTGNKLFRNTGVSGGVARFTDVTAALPGDSIVGTATRQVGAAFFDFNEDSKPDLYLVEDNDAGAPDPAVTNHLFRNDGSLRFTDVTAQAGVGDAGIGLGSPAILDGDGDGHEDLLVLNRVTEVGGVQSGSNVYYRNLGNGAFEDKTSASGLSGIVGQVGAFAVLDFDNDGDEDLYLAGDPALSGAGPSVSKGGILLRNDSGTFVDVTEGAGVTEAFKKQMGANTVTRPVRRLVTSDADEDGRVDLFAATGASTTGGAPPSPNRSLRNVLSNGNHFLEIRLIGRESNPDGIGARVTVRTPNRTLVRTVSGNGGDSLVSHVGLRSETVVDEVRVRWPSGVEQIVPAPAADQLLVLEEPFAKIELVATRDINGGGLSIGGISFGNNPPGTSVDISDQFLEIRFDLADPSTGIAIYTDNQQLNPPFTGSGEGAGLVGRTDTTVALPLFYQVFDVVQGQVTFPTDSQSNSTVGKVQDRRRGDYLTDAALDARTVVNGAGLLAPFPQAGRQTAQSTVFVYFATDFKGAIEQQYAANLMVEAYQKT